MVEGRMGNKLDLLIISIELNRNVDLDVGL